MARRAVPVLALVTVLGAACGDREPGRRREPAPAPRRPVDAAGCEPRGGTTCAGDQVVECRPDGSRGQALETCRATCRDGACIDTCAFEDAELVYVVDSRHTLLRFDPRKLPGDPFERVRDLTCDDRSAPFSMAVDREGIAWVLYDDGRVHRVSIVDGTCWRGGTAPEGAPLAFGMGFASKPSTPDAEVLYGAGVGDPSTLARIDVAQRPPRWEFIARIGAAGRRNPELTGTADGKLFGYFPAAAASFVQEIDAQSGAPVGPRLEVTGARGDVEAYAFAHWGGVFYVFATIDGNSAVHAVDRKTGAYRLVREHLPQRIVGAGVSTCAPLVERVP